MAAAASRVKRIALDEVMRTGRAAPGDRVLLIACGGGLTWAGGVWTI